MRLGNFLKLEDRGREWLKSMFLDVTEYPVHCVLRWMVAIERTQVDAGGYVFYRVEVVERVSLAQYPDIANDTVVRSEPHGIEQGCGAYKLEGLAHASLAYVADHAR